MVCSKWANIPRYMFDVAIHIHFCLEPSFCVEQPFWQQYQYLFAYLGIGKIKAKNMNTLLRLNFGHLLGKVK